MHRIMFDISRKRFHPGWLILGAIVGNGLGYFGAMQFGFWYFTVESTRIGWQIFGAIACALFSSFAMTSDATSHTKGAVLGLGLGFSVAFYGGMIWIHMQPARAVGGLAGMTFAEGIFYDWLIMHLSWLGAIVGWIVGAVIAGRRRAQT
jgi:hypothetical protein